MIHGVSPEIPGRLVVKIDWAGSYAHQYIPHPGKNIIEDDPGAEYFGIEPRGKRSL